MDMEIVLSGGKKVDVLYNGFTIPTDQSQAAGGEGSAPEPFALFLASLGACAGFYVLAFCQNRQIPTEGIRLIQRTLPREDGKGLGRVEIEVLLPAGFPEKYEQAVLRAADQCAVKKAILNPPEMVLSSRRV